VLIIVRRFVEAYLANYGKLLLFSLGQKGDVSGIKQEPGLV